MNRVVFKLRLVLLVLALLILSACNVATSPLSQEHHYVASVEIDATANADDIAAEYGASIISFNPKAGYAVLGFSKEAGELTSLTTSVNQNTYSNPEAAGNSAWASGFSAWSSGNSVWSSGWSAWSSGWSAWSSGLTNQIPSLPEENTSLFNQIKLEQALGYSENYGQGIKVAVIDTGIDLNHPAFEGRFAPSNEWKDFVDSDLVPQEEGFIGEGAYGHGTAVAGIVLQVSPLATILPIRVLNPEGVGDLDDVILAIEHAVQMGADIINLSLGTVEYSAALANVMDFALNQGVYVVAAAGNTGDTNMIHPAAGAELIYNEYGLISVGSIDQFDNKSKFSSYGEPLEYVAPGEKILTLYPEGNLAQVTGTSFATPLVSGALALFMSDQQLANVSSYESYIALSAESNLFSDGKLNVAGAYSYITPEPNDSSSSTTVSTTGSWVRSGGVSSTSFRNPSYSFTVNTTGNVTIDLSSNVDTYLFLLDNSGQVIATDDDGGSGYNSRISQTLSAGNYQVVAATYSSRQTGVFNLNIQGDVSNLR